MEEECCPKFNPKKWENKIFNWKNKRFIKDKVLTFFYIPLNFGRVITRMMKKVELANAKCKDWLMLSDHTSKWNMDIYLAVNKKIPGVKNTTLSGKFLTKVYEGDFKETGKWCKEFEAYVKRKKLVVEKMYMWYTTCPKCAKKYENNYIVIVGKIQDKK